MEYGEELSRMSRSGVNFLKENRGDNILSNRWQTNGTKYQTVSKNQPVFKSRLQIFKSESISNGVPVTVNFGK